MPDNNHTVMSPYMKYDAAGTSTAGGLSVSGALYFSNSTARLSIGHRPNRISTACA